VTGNTAMSSLTLGQVSIAVSYGLNDILNVSNTSSNIIQLTNATTGLVATGNVHALKFIGDGSGLTGITSNLDQIVNNGNVTSNTVQFSNAITSLTAASNVVVTGNVTAGSFLGDGSLLTGISSTLQAITDSGNVTSNTVQFSNATTGFVTTANVEVGTANLFVDTSSSRVGIGTDSPNEPLDIYGAGMRIHHLGGEPKIDFLRGGTNRTPSGALNTFGASNYTDWRIGASGANLKFQQQYIGANFGNIIDVMTMEYGTGNVEIPGYLKTGNPAFYAYRIAAGNADESYITYNATYVNIGNHINTSTGTFTCPVAGIYTFTWGAIGNNTVGVYRYHIHKNNANIDDVHLRLDTSSGKYGDGERTVMLSLVANDTIRIYYKDTDGTLSDYGYNYTYLQGHLISYI
jgi:hypothetical protein